MPFTPADLLAAWLLDAAIGDPRWIPWPHPVVLMGRAVSRLEGWLWRPGDAPWGRFWRGAVLWALVVAGAAAAAWGGLAVAHWVHPWMGRALSIYLAYACLATRDLDAEARAVEGYLHRGRLGDARLRLARIVGRDTQHLPPPEVARATVETVAENASDGAVAPLLYLGLGGLLGWGPTLAVAYKAVNTLDSSVGYRDARYEHFGKLAARADDGANWVPARVTAALAAVAAQVLWGSGRPALRIAWRDGRLHASPNSGFPEAAFAGALGVGLGGTNTYRGVPRRCPPIGDPGPELGPVHIGRARGLLWAVSALALGLGMAALWA
ncbi:MAG: adenosylcobinamide-phosphate synthase CbiB [Thermodesulfobacteriota bacterium]